MTTPNPLPCGCRAMMRLDTMTGQSLFTRQCALHAAAKEMLEALVALEAACGNPWKWDTAYSGERFDCGRSVALVMAETLLPTIRAAIKAAGGAA
jgi:hypothetical protein